MEVDLTRQVLMMIVDNKVVMTIHVSTGKYGTPTGAVAHPDQDQGLAADLPGSGLVALLLHGQERHPRLPERPDLPREPRLRPHPHLGAELA